MGSPFPNRAHLHKAGEIKKEGKEDATNASSHHFHFSAFVRTGHTAQPIHIDLGRVVPELQFSGDNSYQKREGIPLGMTVSYLCHT